MSNGELNEFSEIVDEVIAISGRATRVLDIISYTNSTIRECQVLDGLFFRRDLTEDQIVATADPNIWTHPRLLRQLRTVFYPASGVYPKLIPPGRAQHNEDYFYYAGNDYYVFQGPAIADNIDLAYYSYRQRLHYYKPLTGGKNYATSTTYATFAIRPAIFNIDTQTYTYYDSVTNSYIATLGSTTLDDAAKNQVRNWLIDLYADTIKEGTLAKLFKSSNDPRSVSTFALYKSMQDDIRANEIFESLGA